MDPTGISWITHMMSCKAYILIKHVQIPITAGASVTGWTRAIIDGLHAGRAVVGGMAAMPAGSWQPAPPVIPHGGRSPAQVPYPALVQVRDIGSLPGQQQAAAAPGGAVGAHPPAAPRQAGWHHCLQHPRQHVQN